MEISEKSKLYGRLSHNSFELKILRKLILIKPKALLLKLKLHLQLGIDFSIVSLGSLDYLVPMIPKAIKSHCLYKCYKSIGKSFMWSSNYLKRLFIMEYSDNFM